MRPSGSAIARRRASSVAATPSCAANPGGSAHIAAPTRCSVASGSPVGSWPVYGVSRVALAIDCAGKGVWVFCVCGGRVVGGF